MATKTFVLKKGRGQAGGIIPLGADRVLVEPGHPFTVDAAQAKRFHDDPAYDEVTAEAEHKDTPKAEAKKDGDTK